MVRGMYKHRRGHTLRNGRHSAEGQVYLVTTVTRDRRRLFEDFEVGTIVSRTLAQPALWPDADLLAWTLMPDHLHLLVQLRAGGDLSMLMQRLKAVTSLEAGRLVGPGGIWQHGFHDRAVRKEESLRDVARYVIANPIRAGLVARVADYPFWNSVWQDPGIDPLDL